jgi:uncharacterized protein YndB with AHSA1/START domain
METTEKNKITVEAFVNAPLNAVWKRWTTPEDIIQWNYASDDWHTPSANNNLRRGGGFLYRMEAKDGSSGFDFSGLYDSIKTHEFIAYTIGDGRKVEVKFRTDGNGTKVMQTFEAESQNPVELQRNGWQKILNNFKKYAESE